MQSVKEIPTIKVKYDSLIFFPCRGCLCDNCTPSLLPLIFDWRTFSRRVTARWWGQSAKNQVSTNQNSRNRWCLIVRRTICATITEWNDLDYSLLNSPSTNFFKQNIFKFIRLGLNKVFNIYNPHGLKILMRFRLGLCHLRSHISYHNFSNSLDEICMCEKYIKSTNHFSLQCPLFLNPLSANPTKWSNTLKIFAGSLPTNCLGVFDHFVELAFKGLKKGKYSWIKFVILTANLLTKMKTLCYTLLFGKENMNDSHNNHILNVTIEYIFSTERFNVPLFE